jgi:hypothetical protein
MFKTLKEKKVFDLKEYRSQLKSYKHMKPEKIFSSLEKEGGSGSN